MANYMYQLHQITKQYPKRPQPANQSISLDIQQGEFFGLLGDNGAGKTTLVKQMANLLAPTSGEIFFMGERLGNNPYQTAKNIGYMAQGGGALNNATVAEAFYFTAHLRGASRQDAQRERDSILERLPVGALRDKPFIQLSGGEKRLVSLGVSLMGSPPVLILDEPTNELAPQNRALVWELLREWHRQRGTTVILVTHNVLEAERVIERVGIMREGKLVAVGRPGVLKAELNAQLRLEIIFTPETPPQLPASAQVHEVSAGRWQLLIERDESTHYLDLLTQNPAIEDFRLGTATLEDLYLRYIEA